MALVSVVGACGADGADEASVESGDVASGESDGELHGVAATVVVTRQRDLIDRGFVNVMTENRSGEDVLIVERRLATGGFDAPAVSGRPIKIGAGRTVAVQVPFGSAVQCDDAGPIAAALAVGYTAGDGTGVDSAEVPLGGTDVLDEIRAKQCAAGEFNDSADVTFGEPRVAGEQFRVTMRIELTDPTRTLTLGDVHGTILVAARRDDSAPVDLDRARPHGDVAITFVVNRCDPHALAEVTKKYGLDVDVSFDGLSPVSVGVDVGGLADALDSIVATCRTRTG